MLNRGWMKLNLDKMNVLFVGSNSTLGNGITSTLGRVVLKAQVCSLGVSLNPVPLMDAQVAAADRNVYYQLRSLCQLCPFLGDQGVATVTISMT